MVEVSAQYLNLQKNTLIYRNVIAMRMVGLWPLRNDSKYKFIHQLYSIAILTWFSVFLAVELVYTCSVIGQLFELIISMTFTLLNILVFCKVLSVNYGRNKFTKIIKTIDDADTEILNKNDAELKNITKEYISEAWFNTYTYITLVLLTVALGAVTPLIDDHVNGPEEIFFKNGTSTGRYKKYFTINLWYPFDENSDVMYPYAYTFVVLSILIGGLFIGIWDTFVFSLIYFGIGQFRILQHQLRNIYKRAEEETVENILNIEKNLTRNIQMKFRECMQLHYKIIEYIHILDKIISPIMFTEFAVCTLMLCAIGLRVIIEGISIRLGFNLIYLLAILTEIFGFYWLANELTLEGLNVGDAIWESKWYQCPVSIQRGLLIMMTRSNIKISLSVGPLYVMSLETFIMILKGAYSYMAFLRQFYN